MKPNPTKVAIGSVLVCALTLGTYSALSVYMMSISERVSADLSRVALIFTMCSICGLLVNLFLGNLIKIVGIRKLIVLNGVVCIIFFMTIAFSKSLIPILIGAFLFGMVNGGFSICQTEISVWFIKGQASMVSLLMVGMGVGAIIISPVLTKSLMLYDLSKVAIVHGLVIGILVILIGLLFMAEPPAVYGMEPVGYEPVVSDGGEESASPASTLTISRIIRFPAFWIIIIGGALLAFVNGAIVSNGATIYQSIGVDAMQSSLCISAYNLALLGFSPLFGIIADRKGVGVGATFVGVATIIGAVAGLLLSGMTGAIITAVLISSCGVCGSLAPVSLIKTFGPSQAGSLIGYAMVVASFAQIIAAPIAAKTYVATGSFNIFFIISVACAAGMIVLILLSTNRKTVEKINNSI